ncbi:hypothetical protein V5O48_010932 [Marasmius crinis-equi]|uniref:Uncharacterized protein n=1 Tax=Marasmius crinis-equi TaxID=585013 RepID=A0ABR3F705_9AGAR
MNTRPDHPSEPSRILQVVPVAGFGTNIQGETDGLNPKFKVLRDETTSQTSLRMTLHGGGYTGQKQKAAFVFRCDHSREKAERRNGKVTSPKFAWSFNGTHSFEWKSVHACPERLNSPPPDNESGEPDEENTMPPPDPDSDSRDEEHDELPTWKETSSPEKPALTSILRLFVLYIASRRPIRALWSSVRRRIRPTSSYEPLEAHQDAEDDTIIEYNGYTDFYAEVDGEEIPLTPSPRRQNFGYGVLK